MISNWFTYFVSMISALVSFLGGWEFVSGVSILGVIVAAGVAGVITNVFYNRGRA